MRQRREQESGYKIENNNMTTKELLKKLENKSEYALVWAILWRI